MSSGRSSLLRGAMLGVASGILSQSAVTTVLHRTPPSTLPGLLRHAWVRRLSTVSAGGEVVANAVVTSLPPRTDPPVLAGRVALGALAGGLAARGSGASGLGGAALGALAAPLGAWASTTSRAKLVKVVPDPVIAVIETVVAFGLAHRATI